MYDGGLLYTSTKRIRVDVLATDPPLVTHSNMALGGLASEFELLFSRVAELARALSS